MYNELRWLARRCYIQRRISSQENYLKLIIRKPEKKIRLVFHAKPPLQSRQELRLYNFRWSRKYRYWHAYFNTNRLVQVKKIYRSILENNTYR